MLQNNRTWILSVFLVILLALIMSDCASGSLKPYNTYQGGDNKSIKIALYTIVHNSMWFTDNDFEKFLSKIVYKTFKINNTRDDVQFLNLNKAIDENQNDQIEDVLGWDNNYFHLDKLVDAGRSQNADYIFVAQISYFGQELNFQSKAKFYDGISLKFIIINAWTQRIAGSCASFGSFSQFVKEFASLPDFTKFSDEEKYKVFIASSLRRLVGVDIYIAKFEALKKSIFDDSLDE